MRSLKTLSRSYGGKFTKQPGRLPGETRDYWLIMESFHALPAGWIRRSARIQRSWGMVKYLAAGTRRTLPNYAIVYIFDGEGVLQEDRHAEPHPVRAGDMMCLFPGIAHVYAPAEGTRWSEFIIEFSGPIFDGWMGAGLLDPAIPVRRLAGGAKDKHYWLRRLQSVVVPLAKRKADPSLENTAQLVSLIAEMCNLWQISQDHAEADWAAQARARLLGLPPRQELDLEQEARHFCLGKQAYRKKFKRLCGITPTLFRSRLLIEQTCHQLISTHSPIKEISFEYGFGNEFYFSRRFKQVTGMSPGEYRRRATE